MIAIASIRLRFLQSTGLNRLKWPFSAFCGAEGNQEMFLVPEIE
jgi:hypothetical protein